jgi:hypothetical protein
VVTSRLAAEPYMLEGILLMSAVALQGIKMPYLARRSLVRIWLQQLGNELLGLLADLFPVALVEDHATVLALFYEIGQVFRPEWRVTAKQRVCDDSH